MDQAAVFRSLTIPSVGHRPIDRFQPQAYVSVPRRLKLPATSHFFRVAALYLAIGWAALVFPLAAQDEAWSASDTRLANHYIKLLQKDPAYGNVLDLLWDLYGKKDQTPLLLQYFRGASEKDSTVAKLIYAHLLRKDEQTDEARDLYSEVLDAQPGSVPALRALAEIADQQNRTAKALSLYTRLVEAIPVTDPDSIPIHLRKASLHKLQSQTDAAVAVWEELLRAYPNNIPLRTEIVSFLLEAGETKIAIGILEELAASDDPRQKLNAIVELNRLHEFVGDFDTAVEAAQRGLRLLHFRNHEYAELFSRLVSIHERFERLPELEEALRSEVSDANPTERSLFDMAEFFRLTASPVGEEETLARLVVILPANIDYRMRLIDARIRNDQYAEAAEVLDAMFAETETPPLDLVLLRARIVLQLQDRDAAEALLDAYLAEYEPDADDVGTIVAFARTNYLDGLVERLLRRDGVSNPLELARFLHERGRDEQAMEAIRTFIDAAGEATTERAARLHQAALVLQELDQRKDAIALIEEAIELAPENGQFLSARANLFVEDKRIVDAIEQLESLWTREEALEKKSEIDQRLFSLLRGHFSEMPEPNEDEEILKSGEIQSLAQYRRLALAASRVGRQGDEPPPAELRDYFNNILETAKTQPTTGNRYRAAWWSFKLQDYQECFQQLTKATAEAGHPVLAVETMLLNLAELNERPTLMVRHLTTLAEIDPANKEDYLQRRAEMRFELGFEDEAVRELKGLVESPDASLSTLATLAKIYRLQGSIGKQLDVWQRAYRQANVFEKRRIIKQLSTALIENGKPEDALKAELELLESESDPVQRRKQLDTQLTIARSHFLLDWLLERYVELSQRHAFDRFYPEALARVHRASGNTREAFEAMKKAYYMSGQSELLLGELGQLADELGDLKSAIYYRRQLLAKEGGDDLENWRTLVEMLERDLRVGEAERLRKRLESKFGRNPDFLRELAKHYLENGQAASAERTLGKLVELRDWDIKARFRFGLLQAERGSAEDALATFETILTETQDTTYPAGFGDRVFPLIRVANLSAEAKDDPGTELDGFVFSVEGYPYFGGTLQDEIAEEFQEPHPELSYLPKAAYQIRLRSLEEAAALSAVLGKADEFVEKWTAGEHPVFEKLWVTRFAGATEAFAQLINDMPEADTYPDRFFAAYLRILAGDAEAAVEWATAENDLTGTQHPRSLYLAMAAFVFLKDNAGDPLFDPEIAYQILENLEISREVGIHIFTKLRAEKEWETAFRVGEIFDESGKMRSGNFLYALSQVAGWTGRNREREQLLDRAIEYMHRNWGNRERSFFFASLTERLGLMDSDSDQALFLSRLADATKSAWDSEGLEQASLIALAGERYDETIRLLGQQAAREISIARPRKPEVEEIRYDQSQRWKLMSQLLRYYGDRLPQNWEYGALFIDAIGGDPIVLPAEEVVVAAFEQFEINRAVHQLEWNPAPERDRIVKLMSRLLVDSERRLDLGKTLEVRGFHREAIAVYEAESLQKDRDYAPLQGLFDVCAEALDPAPALAIIDRVNTREFPAPPGLTVDYLNEQHARFLLIDRDIERLLQLSRPPVAGGNVPPVTRQAHVPYQDALVEAYRQMGRDDALLRLVTHLRSRDEASESQLVVAGETLVAAGRLEEALEWFREAEGTLSESDLVRRAMLKEAEVHEALGFPDKARIAELARESLERQPTAVTRSLAETLFRAGATDEAVGILSLLRRDTSDSAVRASATTAMLRMRKESGEPWDDLCDDLETFFRDVEDSEEFVQWIASTDTEGLVEVIDRAATNLESRWLADLVIAFANDNLEGAARAAYADSGDDRLLETLSFFGEVGQQIAVAIVDETARPGTDFFRNEPERQLTFFNRIGDRPRLLEVHEVLMREAESDLFHQHGLEDWYPTLFSRRPNPVKLAEFGETELAASLFRRYRETLTNFQWHDQPFLEEYAEFLIASGSYDDAEELLKKVFQKSIGVDLRLLMRLYSEWGKLDQWEERVEDIFLTEGRMALLREWRTALAEGREMVEATDP